MFWQIPGWEGGAEGGQGGGPGGADGGGGAGGAGDDGGTGGVCGVVTGQHSSHPTSAIWSSEFHVTTPPATCTPCGPLAPQKRAPSISRKSYTQSYASTLNAFTTIGVVGTPLMTHV